METLTFSSNHRRVLPTALLALTITVVAGPKTNAIGQAQPTPPASSSPTNATATPSVSSSPTNGPPIDKALAERLATLERDNANNKQRLDDTNNILLGLGALGSLGLLLFGFLSWYQQHQNLQ